MANGSKGTKAPFGTLLGTTDGGVQVYSSDYTSLDPLVRSNRGHFQSLFGDITTGYKWQCVELGRRYLLVNYGVIFDNIAMAYDIFRLKSVTRVSDGELLPMYAHSNGISTVVPSKGSLLIWKSVGEFHQTGHVAVVVHVGTTYVDIVEQNVHDTIWPSHQQYSRRLPLRIDPHTGACTIDCTYADSSILGWMTIDFSSVYNYEDVPVMALTDIDTSTHTLSQTGQETLEYATNQLHHMVLDATDYVLQHSDACQSSFAADIPPHLWTHLRTSWYAQKPDDFVSKFAFTLSSSGLHWNGFTGNSLPSFSTAIDAHEPLIQAWQAKRLENNCLHVLTDDPSHVIAQETAAAAGWTCVPVESLSDLIMTSDGMLDKQNRPVHSVWHAIPWQVLLQYRDPSTLLHPSVRWFEPLWTMLSSSPALVPIVKRLYPQHPLVRNPPKSGHSIDVVTYAIKGKYGGAALSVPTKHLQGLNQDKTL